MEISFFDNSPNLLFFAFSFLNKSFFFSLVFKEKLWLAFVHCSVDFFFGVSFKICDKRENKTKQKLVVFCLMFAQTNYNVIVLVGCFFWKEKEKIYSLPVLFSFFFFVSFLTNKPILAFFVFSKQVQNKNVFFLFFLS